MARGFGVQTSHTKFYKVGPVTSCKWGEITPPEVGFFSPQANPFIYKAIYRGPSHHPISNWFSGAHLVGKSCLCFQGLRVEHHFSGLHFANQTRRGGFFWLRVCLGLPEICGTKTNKSLDLEGAMKTT